MPLSGIQRLFKHKDETLGTESFSSPHLEKNDDNNLEELLARLHLF